MKKISLHKEFFCMLIYLTITGCAKEYSCENCSASPIRDSIITTTSTIPYTCTACIGADKYSLAKWSFYNDKNFYCGNIDTAIALPERYAFTFFGPSSCSIDSGMVITIIIEPMTLTKDFYNYVTGNVGFFYYDNIGRTHPFISRRGDPFSVSIESYVHLTRTMTGQFGGTVFKPNGEQTTVSGKFKVRIP